MDELWIYPFLIHKILLWNLFFNCGDSLTRRNMVMRFNGLRLSGSSGSGSLRVKRFGVGKPSGGTAWRKGEPSGAPIQRVMEPDSETARETSGVFFGTRCQDPASAHLTSLLLPEFGENGETRRGYRAGFLVRLPKQVPRPCTDQPFIKGASASCQPDFVGEGHNTPKYCGFLPD